VTYRGLRSAVWQELAPLTTGSTLVLVVAKEGGSGGDATFARRASEKDDRWAR